MRQTITFGYTKLIHLGAFLSLIALWTIVLDISAFRRYGVLSIILSAVLVFGISHTISLSKTAVDEQGICIRHGLWTHVYPWADIIGLTISPTGKVSLVCTSPGRKTRQNQHRLPGVGAKDIEKIVAFSQNHISS